MDHDAFKSWLHAYGRAWETRNPEAATALFTDDAIYQETPFDQPFYGRSGILQYWSNVPRYKEQVKFRYEVLAVTETIGIARWWASFVRIPSRTESLQRISRMVAQTRRQYQGLAFMD